MEGRAFPVSVKALDVCARSVKPDVVWKVNNPLVESACYVMEYLNTSIFPSASVSPPTDSEAGSHRPFYDILPEICIFLGVNYCQKGKVRPRISQEGPERG